MIWKRSILAILTILSLFSVVFSLSQSLGEPQVQAQLELYQTNLILNASSWSPSEQNLNSLSQNLIGENPLSLAKTSYEKALDLTEDSFKQLVENPSSIEPKTTRQKFKNNTAKTEKLLDDLNIKIGIINAQENQINFNKNNSSIVLNYWDKVTDRNLQETLESIWINRENIDLQQEKIVQEKLKGWFQIKTLQQLYLNQNNQTKLEEINQQEQILAEKSVYRLIILSIIPVFGGIIGFGLLIFLLIQLILKKENSLLAINHQLTWESPWDWEIIWQVFIVGFFFLSQVLLPLLFGVSGFNPVNLGIQGKSLYVLVSYLLMAGGGLFVLYLSLKPFFPLPENWFKFTEKKWYWWGIGGYLVAIPCVFFVSILNQQLWQGRGGSNPLLLLALESQDKFALTVFFITASIAAPFFEEIMFRGFLLPSLTRYFSLWTSIIISAFVFAIAHLSLAETIPLATLGIILGIVYTRSRSLFSSILLHSLWNGGTLFSLFMLGTPLSIS